MSADKDRGIRRQKQKRAKAMKKQTREQHAGACGSGEEADLICAAAAGVDRR